MDPWKLRAAALERILTPNEWAVVLYHIAKHRGARLNRKGEQLPSTLAKGKKPEKTGKNTAKDEQKKVLKALRKP